MGRKVSDGKSVKVAVGANTTITQGDFYLLGGVLGWATQGIVTNSGGEVISFNGNTIPAGLVAAEVVLNTDVCEYETSQIDTDDAFVKGDKVYWDSINGRFTTVAGDGFLVGVVTVAKDANDIVWLLFAPFLDVLGESIGTSDIGAGAVTQAKLAAAVSALMQGAPAFTIGDELANVINVAVQLKDAAGTAIAAKHSVHVWLSDNASGAECAVAPDGDVVIDTDGEIVKSYTAKLNHQIVTGSDGKFDLDITESGAKTLYVNVEYQGKVYSSGAVTFAP